MHVLGVSCHRNLTVKPGNVAAERSSNVTLQCAKGDVKTLSWHLNHTVVNSGYEPNKEFPRHSVLRHEGHHDLFIRNLQLKDAGRYKCSYTHSFQPTAEIVVIGELLHIIRKYCVSLDDECQL